MTTTTGFSEIIADAAARQVPELSWVAITKQLRTLQASLRKLDGDAETSEWLLAARDCLSAICRVGVLVAWERTPSGWSAASVAKKDADPDVVRQLSALVPAVAEQEVVTTRLLDRAKSPWFVVAMVVDGATNATDKQHKYSILSATFGQHGEPDDWFVALLEEVASAMRTAQLTRTQQQTTEELAGCAAVLELAAKIEATSSLDVACQVLVEEAAKHLQATVAFGMTTRANSNSTLRAISGSSGVDRDAARSRAIGAAVDEVLTQGRLTVYPAPHAVDRHGLLTHQRLVRDGLCQAVFGVPLRDRSGDLIGAWVCLGDESLIRDSAAQRFLRACEFRLGDSLRLLRRAERAWWRRWLERTNKRWGVSVPKMMAFGTVLFAAVMCVPWSHRLRCDIELQPVTRRFVAAPFDGTLERAFVEPGQIVAEGDLLAQLDDREITWEQAGLDAEQQRAAKERDSRLAKHEIAASQLAKYDFEKLELRRKLLSNRSEHLEIRSPIAGLVIVGDWKKSEGVPLATGKNLFEIAPLDRMLVEVAISERDIAHSATGQAVDMTLEGFPGEHWSGQLVRVHPRSEIRHDTNVFIGEVELDNPNGRLLPGMQGQARIAAGTRSVGWLLFHRLAEAVLSWTGW